MRLQEPRRPDTACLLQGSFLRHVPKWLHACKNLVLTVHGCTVHAGQTSGGYMLCACRNPEGQTLHACCKQSI